MQTTQSESPKTRSETRYVRNGKAGFLKIFGEMRLEISLQVSVVIKWKQGHSETINSIAFRAVHGVSRTKKRSQSKVRIKIKCRTLHPITQPNIVGRGEPRYIDTTVHISTDI